MLGEAVTPPILLGIVCFLAGSLVSILPDILRARRAGQGRLAGEAAALLECPFQPEENAFQMVEHMGPGYALPNPEDTPYIEELARTEGILLDPVYTGKAFAGMMQLLRQGAFDGQDDLLFVHTGGTAALFAIDLPR